MQKAILLFDNQLSTKTSIVRPLPQFNHAHSTTYSNRLLAATYFNQRGISTALRAPTIYGERKRAAIQLLDYDVSVCVSYQSCNSMSVCESLKRT
jgi:hypothetical protein